MNNEKGKDYWEERAEGVGKFWGKGKLILEISKLLSSQKSSVLELGCGEGHILANLQAFNPNADYYGIDYNLEAISRARGQYPGISFEGIGIQDFLDKSKSKYDIVIASNVFHEIFSTQLLTSSIIDSKENIKNVILRCTELLRDDGIFVLLDGVECTDSDFKEVTFRIMNNSILEKYHYFISTYSFLDREYSYSSVNSNIVMNSHDFTRFITKLRFVGGKNWEIEKNETYQYFNTEEFIQLFKLSKLSIFKKELFISDLRSWEKSVQLIDGEYPFEHILLMAKVRGTNEKEV